MSAQGSALGWFAKPAKATDLVMGGIRKPRAWVMARHQRWRRTRELVLVPYRLRWLYDRKRRLPPVAYDRQTAFQGSTGRRFPTKRAALPHEPRSGSPRLAGGFNPRDIAAKCLQPRSGCPMLGQFSRRCKTSASVRPSMPAGRLRIGQPRCGWGKRA